MTYGMYGLLLLAVLLGLSCAGLITILRRDPKDLYQEPDFPRMEYRI